YFWQQSRGKKQAIKTWIMDSQLVVGVGNIYACESLFLAKINPTAVVGSISKKRLERLQITIKQVLTSAIEQGGTTLKDFVGSDGKPGYFKQELNVYGRADLPCKVCLAPIQQITQGQRSTFFCRKCQKT
ncbi:MAG: DNA-formamidopyrimidine glycosylase, partial [Sinobacterium sp.]|nr:DNA-formamidopyrimidine glycosylase [Sinobacterium sp.]